MRDVAPSPWLYEFLKAREQFRPTAFKPTKRDVWTIGYGHTKGVQPGDTCTLDQADQLLTDDVAWAAETVRRCVTVPLTQPQFDALVSFVYNIGAPAFVESRVLRFLDDGNYAAAAHDMLAWDHQRGEVLAGLTARREQERARFLSPA